MRDVELADLASDAARDSGEGDDVLEVFKLLQELVDEHNIQNSTEHLHNRHASQCEAGWDWQDVLVWSVGTANSLAKSGGELLLKAKEAESVDEGGGAVSLLVDWDGCNGGILKAVKC